jgi:hypothetical protein
MSVKETINLKNNIVSELGTFGEVLTHEDFKSA